MTTLLTGVTGYIGSYVAHELLQRSDERLAVLVRAKSIEEAKQRLWKSLQLHLDFDEFRARAASASTSTSAISPRPSSGSTPRRASPARRLHALGHALRRVAQPQVVEGLLQRQPARHADVLKLVRAAQDHHGLRRFSDVSTVAVAGTRSQRGGARGRRRSTGIAATTTRTRARRSSAST